jgi:hypothetical protein
VSREPHLLGAVGNEAGDGHGRHVHGVSGGGADDPLDACLDPMAVLKVLGRELLERARDDLERLGRGLGGRYYRTDKQVTDRIAVIAKQRRVTAYLHTTVGTDPTTSKPTLEWHFDQAAIDAEAATDAS